MTRVASLYLPHWSIDRVRRTERRAAPMADAGPAYDALREVAAADRAGQCSVPNEGGWRPGARWARRGDSLADSREAVEAAVAALPPHRRPPQRELGRVSEQAEHPFAGAGRELSRRSEAADHPFRPMPPDEAAGGPALRLPGEDRRRPVPRYRNEAPARPLSITDAAALPPVQGPGEDMEARRAMRAPRRSSRDGHDGEANAPGAAEGRFFQTGRTLGSAVARVCRDGDAPAPAAGGEPPLVTVDKVGSRVTIAAASPAARALGLAPRLALTQARMLVPGLEVRPADPAGDRADLLRLAERLARRWTPIVAVSDADGLLLDLTGVAHLHGGEARMLARLVRLLARAGITARAAVADTAGAAWAAARFGTAQPAPSATFAVSVMVIPPGGQLDALAPLPVAALRLEPPALELLARLGIDSVGQLLALPRAPLVRRFGAAIATRLDQATGRAPEPLHPIRPPEPIAVVQRFAEPIATPEAIAHWLGDLVPRLAAALAAAGLGARAIELVGSRVDGVPQRLRVGFARPTREPAPMLRLVLRRIEEIEPGYGLDALALHVRRADPLGPVSLAPSLAEETAPDLGPLVDTLANRIGPGRLWRETPVASDVPERSLGLTGPLDDVAAAAPRLRRDDVRRLDARTPDHPWHPRWPRPVRLLRRPERVDHVVAMLPDQPPRRFTWRGRTHQVVRADGPERIGGEWWRRPAERRAVRDYFQVEDEAGERFWLYRRGDGVRPETGDLSWYLHGRFA